MRVGSLAWLFFSFFALPLGLSVTGCGHHAAPVVYCNAGDSGPVVGQVATITLSPSLATTGESLNYGQMGTALSANAIDCKGNAVSVRSFTYASTSSFGANTNGGPIVADINPATGQVCGGTWNRNTGGGIADYTTCTPPSAPPAAPKPIVLTVPATTPPAVPSLSARLPYLHGVGLRPALRPKWVVVIPPLPQPSTAPPPHVSTSGPFFVAPESDRHYHLHRRVRLSIIHSGLRLHGERPRNSPGPAVDTYSAIYNYVASSGAITHEAVAIWHLPGAGRRYRRRFLHRQHRLSFLPRMA